MNNHRHFKATFCLLNLIKFANLASETQANDFNVVFAEPNRKLSIRELFRRLRDVLLIAEYLRDALTMQPRSQWVLKRLREKARSEKFKSEKGTYFPRTSKEKKKNDRKKREQLSSETTSTNECAVRWEFKTFCRISVEQLKALRSLEIAFHQLQFLNKHLTRIAPPRINRELLRQVFKRFKGFNDLHYFSSLELDNFVIYTSQNPKPPSTPESVAMPLIGEVMMACKWIKEGAEVIFRIKPSVPQVSVVGPMTYVFQQYAPRDPWRIQPNLIRKDDCFQGRIIFNRSRIHERLLCVSISRVSNQNHGGLVSTIGTIRYDSKRRCL
ncbi:hypothetical protein M3Y98_00003400 [Aphelenchoides besseyi]|nr:hypothetical protein M3Y98_00003400 [Aphelenchoides besseyi]